MSNLKNLKGNTYSKEYVTTNYGYTIIFRLDQKEKDDLNDIKDDIRGQLASELMLEDENLYYQSLIKLRKDNNIKDTILKKKYKAYCEQFK